MLLTVTVSARECRSLWQTSVSGRSSGGLCSWMRSPEMERSSVTVRNSERVHSCKPELLPPLNHTHQERKPETCTPVGLQGQPHFARSLGRSHNAGGRSLWVERSVVGRAEDRKLGKEDIRWQ